MLEAGFRNAILLTRDGEAATREQWELGPFPAGDGLGAMAGWTVASEEGGVPPAVARTFARAMTRYGRVTFPCSTIETSSKRKTGMEAGWREVRALGDDHAMFTLVAGNAGGRRGWGQHFGGQTAVPLLSTLREATVAGLLFEDPFFQWWNASQCALVSRPPEKLPAGLGHFAVELLDKRWAGVAAAAAAVVIRSGVDGDVCGLAFANEEVRRAFEILLDAAAVENGLVVRTVSYVDFGQLLSEALADRPET